MKVSKIIECRFCENEAVATCDSCGIYLCEDCLETTVEGSHRCPPCMTKRHVEQAKVAGKATWSFWKFIWRLLNPK